jgi:hypothetical protein
MRTIGTIRPCSRISFTCLPPTPRDNPVDVGQMSERTLNRKGRLTAVCMLIAAMIVIGLVVAGMLPVSEPRAPIAVVKK